MSPAEYPGVIIDGAVPRNDYERCVTVFDYLLTLPSYVVTDKTEEIDPGHMRARLGETWQDSHWWGELEDDIIDAINGALPDEYVCTVGEANPGDVIVREIQAVSEEML